MFMLVEAVYEKRRLYNTEDANEIKVFARVLYLIGFCWVFFSFFHPISELLQKQFSFYRKMSLEKLDSETLLFINFLFYFPTNQAVVFTTGSTVNANGGPPIFRNNTETGKRYKSFRGIFPVVYHHS